MNHQKYQDGKVEYVFQRAASCGKQLKAVIVTVSHRRSVLLQDSRDGRPGRPLRRLVHTDDW